MTGLGVFNLLAIGAAVIGLIWWLVPKLLRSATRVVVTERDRVAKPPVAADDVAVQRQALLDAIEDPDDRAAVQATFDRVDWRRDHGV